MPSKYSCPICGRQSNEGHYLDCHFTNMSRNRMITTLIPAPRLDPTGTTYICDACHKTWGIATNPECARCLSIWQAIDEVHPHAD